MGWEEWAGTAHARLRIWRSAIPIVWLLGAISSAVQTARDATPRIRRWCSWRISTPPEPRRSFPSGLAGSYENGDMSGREEEVAAATGAVPGAVGSTTADPGVSAASCWTTKRLRLRDWLQRTAPQVAQVYAGAVTMAFDPDFPGRVVCSCGTRCGRSVTDFQMRWQVKSTAVLHLVDPRHGEVAIGSGVRWRGLACRTRPPPAGSSATPRPARNALGGRSARRRTRR
jgi:hypothetical protein